MLQFMLTPSLSLSQRWIVNGNIQCFHGFHAGLSVLAVSVLLLCILIIPLILLYAIILKVSNC